MVSLSVVRSKKLISLVIYSVRSFKIYNNENMLLEATYLRKPEEILDKLLFSCSSLAYIDGEGVSRTCNFLVTSGLRLDITSVNLGPATTHFMPSPETRLFLDVSSITACKSELSNQKLSRSQMMPSLYLLKQVRSKFDYLSTYTMCRSVSSIASQLEFQPTTIWTFCDQESSHHISASNEKIGSLLFREFATRVIEHLKLITKTKKGSTVDSIFCKICELFDPDQDQITIVGNTLFNSQLTDLCQKVTSADT